MKKPRKQLQQYALITGAASGLGKAAASFLTHQGFVVFACDRSYKETMREGKLHHVNMDVSSDLSVKAAFDYIRTQTDRLDIVSCFAGIISAGALMETSAEEASKMFEVNVLGTYRVNKEAFEMVREAKGRYINISSEYGQLKSVPFYTLYPATKHALEMYNIGLRRELRMFRIPVVCIRPGAFKTDIINNFTTMYDKAIEKSQFYMPQLQRVSGLMEKEFAKAKEPAAFIKAFRKAAFKKKPKFVYKVNNSFTMKLLNILPEKLQDRLIYKMLFKKK